MRARAWRGKVLIMSGGENTGTGAVLAGLEAISGAIGPGPVTQLRRLSGGASQETWAFDVGPLPCILRRPPGGARTQTTQGIGVNVEAAAIEAARAAGAPAPEVLARLDPAGALGPGYVMRRLAGETLAPKIMRDPAFAQARARFARQAGAAAARIHAAPRASLPELPVAGAREQLALYEETYRSFDQPRPALDFGFAALRARAPDGGSARLSHGDFRLGNLMIDAEGLVAALDWEMAHLGDPAEDLGWICTPSWRFGAIDKPAGGLGGVEELLAGYREAGGDQGIDLPRVRFWMMMGSLKWAVMCMTMYRTFATGVDTSLERPVIARRASEAELDLLLMLQGKL